MKFQIGAMSLGDILDRGLKLLLARLPTFYAISLIVQLPTLLSNIALAFITMGGGQPTQAQGIMMAVGGLAVLFLILILYPIGSAATLFVISQEFVDQKATLGDAFRFAGHSFGRLLGASFLAGLIIVLGFVFCVVPGIVFLIWYIFVSQVVVVEKLGGNSALARSKELTSGYVGRILALGIILFVVSILIGIAVGLLQLVLPSMHQVRGAGGLPVNVMNPANYLINQAVSFLINVLVSTYGTICLTLLYYDIRIRKEGFDLELAAQKQLKAIS